MRFIGHSTGAWLIGVALPLTLVTPLFAEPPDPPIDPRLAGPAVKALQAEIALREALIQAIRDDQQKKDAELADWFKAWFGEQKVGQAK